MKTTAFILILSMLNLGTNAWSKDETSREKEAISPQEEFDCIDCTYTRGPAVVLDKDVDPAKKMDVFIHKLPIKDKENSPSRSPAVITP